MEEVVTELQDIQDFSYISGQIVNIISEQSFEEDTFKLVIQTATDQSNSELDCVSFFILCQLYVNLNMLTYH
jgi:hypothetical protein